MVCLRCICIKAGYQPWKKDKTSFKTDTLDVAITVTNADSEQYKVNNGEWVAFSNITTATVGRDTAINAYTTLTVSAANANGTETAAYQYLKKDPNAPVGNDGSTTPALTGKFATNPNNQYGVRKTISVNGDKSDWESSILIAQGTANGDNLITIADATLIQKVAAGFETLTDKYVKAADVDSNGTINIKDATLIQKYIVGINTGYNIGSAI